MNTTANLLVILIFLSGLYTFLGLICGVVEKVQELLARPHQRRRVRTSTRRRTPRRELASMSSDVRIQRPLRETAREKAA